MWLKLFTVPLVGVLFVLWLMAMSLVVLCIGSAVFIIYELIREWIGKKSK